MHIFLCADCECVQLCRQKLGWSSDEAVRCSCGVVVAESGMYVSLIVECCFGNCILVHYISCDVTNWVGPAEQHDTLLVPFPDYSLMKSGDQLMRLCWISNLKKSLWYLSALASSGRNNCLQHSTSPARPSLHKTLWQEICMYFCVGERIKLRMALSRKFGRCKMKDIHSSKLWAHLNNGKSKSEGLEVVIAPASVLKASVRKGIWKHCVIMMLWFSPWKSFCLE